MGCVVAIGQWEEPADSRPVSTERCLTLTWATERQLYKQCQCEEETAALTMSSDVSTPVSELWFELGFRLLFLKSEFFFSCDRQNLRLDCVYLF